MIDVLIYTCDRCGVEVRAPHEGRANPPNGWRLIIAQGLGENVADYPQEIHLCPDCNSELVKLLFHPTWQIFDPKYVRTVDG